MLENAITNGCCCVSPCDLPREKQWVGFKSHGSVCWGWGFGEDQTDKHIQATVARQEITRGKQACSEAQQAGEEELAERG